MHALHHYAVSRTATGRLQIMALRESDCHEVARLHRGDTKTRIKQETCLLDDCEGVSAVVKQLLPKEYMCHSI